jgi:hypothetical protein
MLTKSRWWLTKSSKGAGRLGDRAIEDDSDTCRNRGGGIVDTLLQGGLAVWASKPPAGWFLGFGPQKLIGVQARTGGGTWRHREACVKAKQSLEETMGIGWTDLELVHFSPGLNDHPKYI